MLKAYRGAKLTAEQAKVALETHLVNQARLDIFGTFAASHIGRTGRKEIRRNLIGARLTSYYPLRSRPHKVMPKLEVDDGLVEFMEQLNFEKPGGSDAPEGEGEAAAEPDAPVRKWNKYGAAKIKRTTVISPEDRQRARFNALVEKEIEAQRPAMGAAEVTAVDRAAIELKVVQQHFIGADDVKMDAAELEAAATEDEKAQQQERLMKHNADLEVLEAARATNASGKVAGAGGREGPAVVPAVSAKLSQNILFEHTVERAMQRIRDRQMQPSDASSSAAPNAAHSSHPLAKVLRKLSLAPESNLSHLLYGPTFLYTSAAENYLLTPQGRPISPSQIAEEARANDRRQRLLTKALNIAPQELSAFRIYCDNTARDLYADGSAQQRRFAAALKKLTDPAACMRLGEREVADERADDAVVRLVRVGAGAGQRGWWWGRAHCVCLSWVGACWCTHLPVLTCVLPYAIGMCSVVAFLAIQVVVPASDAGAVKFACDTSSEAERAQAAESSSRERRAVHQKLLVRADAEGDLVRLSKVREAGDRATMIALEKFQVGGPKALRDAAEKQLVVRALVSQLDDEEAMYEAVEQQELNVRQLTPVTMMQLQTLRKSLVCGRAQTVFMGRRMGERG